jgi:hypothetical protein
LAKSADDAEWRRITEREKRLVERLLSGTFEGAEELRSQLTDARVRTLDESGSIEFAPCSAGAPSAVSQRVPAEGEVVDTDGVVIHVLVHVIDGLIRELELHKEDGSAVQRPVLAADLTVR